MHHHRGYMSSSTVDFALTLSRDPAFAELFPAVSPEMQFSDSQALLRFLDDHEGRLVILLDGRLDVFPGWAKNHFVIVFHDYSEGHGSDLYDSGDVGLAFNRDDDAAYGFVNGIIEHMLV